MPLEHRSRGLVRDPNFIVSMRGIKDKIRAPNKSATICFTFRTEELHDYLRLPIALIKTPSPLTLQSSLRFDPAGCRRSPK
jgi:hypothetical protein